MPFMSAQAAKRWLDALIFIGASTPETNPHTLFDSQRRHAIYTMIDQTLMLEEQMQNERFARAQTALGNGDMTVLSVDPCKWIVVSMGTSPKGKKSQKRKECSCGAPYCEAIEAVRQYLQAGGLRAPDPDGMPPCPICGSKTYRDRTWDGKYTRTLGWRCVKGGLRHFLEAKAERIKQQFAANPWLIPPAPGYPGVRREELWNREECRTANRQSLPDLVDDPMI
jgi:hypothetical protein